MNKIRTAFQQPPQKSTHFVGFLLAFEAEDLSGVVKAYDDLENTAVIVTSKWLIPPWEKEEYLRLLTDYQILQLGLSIFSALPAWDASIQAGSVIETFEALLALFEEEAPSPDKPVDLGLIGQIKLLSSGAYQRLGLDWWCEFTWRQKGGTGLADLQLYRSFMNSIRNFLIPETLMLMEESVSGNEDAAAYVEFHNSTSDSLCHPFNGKHNVTCIANESTIDFRLQSTNPCTIQPLRILLAASTQLRP